MRNSYARKIEGEKDLLLWKDDQGNLHAIGVDAVKTHSDERTAQVTQHPVEDGADVSDHVIHNPDVVTFEIMHSDTPIDPVWTSMTDQNSPFRVQSMTLDVRESLFQPGGLLAVTRAVGGAINAGLNAIGLGSSELETKVNVLRTDQVIDRIGDLHTRLIDLKQNARRVTFTYRGRVYPDFIVRRVSWATMPGEVGLGRFTIEAQSVRTVRTGTAELPDPESLRLKPAVQKKPPPKPVEEPEKEKKRGSLLKAIGSRVL